MIKLIAADMDGTLLNSRRELPPDFGEVIDALHRRGIHFAAASGRQYYNLLNIFAGMEHKIDFICENGAIVFADGKNLGGSKIDYKKLPPLLRAIRKLDNPFAIFCGVKSAYIEKDNAEFVRNAGMYYERCALVDDLLEAAKNDMICKVALFHPEDAEHGSLPAVKHFESEFLLSVSGKNWIDFMNHGTNKGTAILRLREAVGAEYDETMAFGDFLNDLEMMDECYYSYAMANAHPELKKRCRFEAPSNDDDGVMRIIREKCLN